MHSFKRQLFLFLGSFLLISCAGGSFPAQAAENPNLIILGDDADEDSVPRNSRVFKRVLAAVSNQLIDEGFKVFDETTVTLDEFAQGRVRRTDAEIIDIAKSIQRPPMDLAVIYTIYANAKKMEYITKVRSRIEGRLLNVGNGQRMGNFEVISPDDWRAPVNCSRECILETVGDHTKQLAQDLGAVLSIKLAHIVDGGGANEEYSDRDSDLPTAYTLVFSGFKPDVVSEIEEYFVAFKGYEHHRPTNTSLRNNEYWYETSSDSARLNRNLRKMLDNLGVEGRVTFSGSIFTVENILPNKRRY